MAAANNDLLMEMYAEMGKATDEFHLKHLRDACINSKKAPDDLSDAEKKAMLVALAQEGTAWKDAFWARKNFSLESVSPEAVEKAKEIVARQQEAMSGGGLPVPSLLEMAFLQECELRGNGDPAISMRVQMFTLAANDAMRRNSAAVANELADAALQEGGLPEWDTAVWMLAQMFLTRGLSQVASGRASAAGKTQEQLQEEMTARILARAGVAGKSADELQSASEAVPRLGGAAMSLVEAEAPKLEKLAADEASELPWTSDAACPAPPAPLPSALRSPAATAALAERVACAEAAAWREYVLGEWEKTDKSRDPWIFCMTDPAVAVDSKYKMRGFPGEGDLGGRAARVAAVLAKEGVSLEDFELATKRWTDKLGKVYTEAAEGNVAGKFQMSMQKEADHEAWLSC